VGQSASDESYKDPTNLQAKIQKHQAFEAEVAAHSNAIVVLDNTGSLPTVFRIRDVFPSRIPDPNCLHLGSASKNLGILSPQKWFLSSRKYDLGCSSRIRTLLTQVFVGPEEEVWCFS
jgi:hypothetical protein